MRLLPRGGSVVATLTEGVGRMFEIIKKASRFSEDKPEVIDHADSLSEAEALAHDYQVNRYGPSAWVVP